MRTAHRASPLGQARLAAVPLLLALLTVYLAFNSGGYFAGATATATLVLAAALALEVLLLRDPLEGMGRGLALAAGALMLYAAWVLISGVWSDATARALIEFDRALLYVLALLAFGLVPRRPEAFQRLVWGLWLALLAICLVGLITRLLPDFWSAQPALQKERLGYPIGYWNALGLAGVIGIVLSLHLTCSGREPVALRLLGAAALPPLAATVYFTFSRGPLAAGVVGVLAYLIIGRPRLAVTGLLAALPAAGLALVAAYDATALSSLDPTTPQALAEGRDLAPVIGLCALGSALLRAAGLPLDRRLVRIKLPRRVAWTALGAAAAALAVGVAVALTQTGLRDRIDEELNRATHDNVLQTEDRRERLTNPGLNRREHWTIALDEFAAKPLHGSGAGTFELLWARDRSTESDSREGHSLYFESLAELGAVGLALLLAALIAIVAGIAARARGNWRTTYAAALAAALLWLLHAAVDWDWELPAVTLWLFALGGAALAAPAAQARKRSPSWLLRGGIVLGCVAVAVMPALVLRSQGHLIDSVAAYDRGDCRASVEAATASLDSLAARPEPYEIVSFCLSRAGRRRPAVASMREAVERDPRNWRYRYGLALVRAAAGLDPHPALRAALALNPREPVLSLARQRFRSRDAAAWRRAAEEARLQIR